MIEKQADINSRDDYCRTPFHYYLQNPSVDVEMVKFFLNNKAKLNMRDNDGRTCFHYASMLEENDQIIQLFLQHNYNLNIQDNSTN